MHHNKKIKEDMLHQGPMWNQKKLENVESLTTELFGDEARRFIKRNKANTFYLQLSFNAVHNFTHQLPPSYLQEKGLKGFADLGLA